MAAGPELCPHCRRPFKRLRAHLPHCKAAPAAPAACPPPGPGSAARPGPSPAPGARPRAPAPSRQPSAASGSATEPNPAPGPCPAPGSGPRAVRDVARSLDLHPEEVRDVPGRLRQGVKVVIEKHRARVVREKEPGPAARKAAPKAGSEEARSRGAAGSGSGRRKGEKSGLKATKTLGEPAESRNSPGDRGQLEGRARAGGERGRLEVGLGSKPPASALHPKILPLALPGAPGAHGRGTPRNELSLVKLRGEAVPEATVSPGTAPGLALPEATVSPGTAPGLGLALPEPTVSPGTAPGLALPEATVSPGTAPGLALPEPRPSPGTAPGLALPLLPQSRPPCPAPAVGSSARAGAVGLEWFPDLYPDSEGLRAFPGKRFHEDVRIAAETPGGGLARGQQGPLSERPLMEVRLGELHAWVSTCSFSPQGLLGAVQRAWGSYCAKYIHVKQGGPAGISMLLAGYCLLSYGWNYQHFKRHRWRKYH